MMSFGTGLQAQFQYDNQWIFSFEDDTTSILDFREDTLVVRKVFQDMKIGSTNGCMSNYFGDFLFYSNGCNVNDSTLALMENGSGINPGPVSDDFCHSDYPSLHQSLLILPSNNNDSLFHIFHKRIYIDINESPFAVCDSLFHSIINIYENNGQGKLIQKNKGINSNTLSNAFLTAVKKENSSSWWIVSAIRNSGDVEIYELTNDTIVETRIESQGSVFPENTNTFQIQFSPKGNYFIRAYPELGVFIYEFNRLQGSFSFMKHIPLDMPFNTSGGAAISSNERFMYINSTIELWQYDLKANNIEASKTLIATYDGFQSPFGSTFYKAQLGPDCKLYYNSNNGEDVLHVMHNPNVKGTACNFEQHGVQLFTSHGISLPYFPSYRLDTDYPICDTTKLVATSINIPLQPQGQVWAAAPNPTTGIFHLATNKVAKDEVHIFIYDASGRLINSADMPKGKKSIELDLSNEFNGVYFYQVIGVDGSSASGRVVKY